MKEIHHEGQLNFGLEKFTAEEALQKFGEGKCLNFDLAKKVNAVSGLYPDDMPIDRLLVYSKEQKQRILYQARDYRKYDANVFGKFLQEFEEEREIDGVHPHLEDRIAYYKETLKNINLPIDVELAPESWQRLMSELTLDQKRALIKTIGSTHDLIYKLRKSYIEDLPVATIADLRKTDLSKVDIHAKRVKSIAEIFLPVAFKKIEPQIK